MAFDTWLKHQSSQAPPSVKALTWSTKRWQYFTEYVAASRVVWWWWWWGDYQEPLQHWFTASSVWIGKKKKKKKKGLWRTCKGISKEHIVIPFFVTSLYVSFLIFRCPCWIEQRYWPLSSSVCLRDEGVSCNVDEVIYCNRVNLFVKTDGVISCAAGSLPKIGAKIAQSCFYTTRRD